MILSIVGAYFLIVCIPSAISSWISCVPDALTSIMIVLGLNAPACSRTARFNSRTAPVGITLLHFDDRMNEFYARSFRAGLPTAIRGEQHPVLSLAHSFVKS